MQMTKQLQPIWCCQVPLRTTTTHYMPSGDTLSPQAETGYVHVDLSTLSLSAHLITIMPCSVAFLPEHDADSSADPTFGSSEQPQILRTHNRIFGITCGVSSFRACGV